MGTPYIDEPTTAKLCGCRSFESIEDVYTKRRSDRDSKTADKHLPSKPAQGADLWDGIRGDVRDRQSVIRHCGFFYRCSAPIGALWALTTQAPQVCFDALLQFRGLGIRGTGLLQE